VKKLALLLVVLLAMPAAFAQEKSTLKPGTYVRFQTSMGDFTAELYPVQAPNTVNNFVGLVRGTKDWKDPRTGQTMKNKPFYDGLAFHRVIDNFMIQGGDPLGNGTGNPGFSLQDEFSKTLKHDRPGRLAMAHSAAPNSAGSQFYITTVPYPSLDGAYAIFGQIVEGMDVVMKISKVKTDPRDKPLTPVVMKKVTIETVK
jgi:peptidyl-prolyl cis-trans isomerase A (cyclophilin A)